MNFFFFRLCQTAPLANESLIILLESPVFNDKKLQTQISLSIIFSETIIGLEIFINNRAPFVINFPVMRALLESVQIGFVFRSSIPDSKIFNIHHRQEGVIGDQ